MRSHDLYKMAVIFGIVFLLSGTAVAAAYLEPGAGADSVSSKNVLNEEATDRSSNFDDILTMSSDNDSKPDEGAGEKISSRGFEEQDLTLRRTDSEPPISQNEAMEAVYDLGVPWGRGDDWERGPVTVDAHYGLATFGEQGNDEVWLGPRNVPLPSGEVLDHVEERPMWIIDYGNTVFHASGCPDCAEPPDYDHTVYAIDAETAEVWFVWGYESD